MKAPAYSILPSILAGILAGSCSAPQHATGPSAVASLDRHTGVILQSEGNTITVLIGDQLAKIRLEGFAEEGRAVAASVARRPAPTKLKAPR